jgi:hypothetical protein
MIKITNPYAKPENPARLNADVPDEVRLLLMRVFPGHGNIQAIVNNLISALVSDLEKENITIYNLINESDILSVLARRCAPINDTLNSPSRDESGATPTSDSNPPRSSSKRKQSKKITRTQGKESSQ